MSDGGDIYSRVIASSGWYSSGYSLKAGEFLWETMAHPLVYPHL